MHSRNSKASSACFLPILREDGTIGKSAITSKVGSRRRNTFTLRRENFFSGLTWQVAYWFSSQNLYFSVALFRGSIARPEIKKKIKGKLVYKSASREDRAFLTDRFNRTSSKSFNFYTETLRVQRNEGNLLRVTGQKLCCCSCCWFVPLSILHLNLICQNPLEMFTFTS